MFSSNLLHHKILNKIGTNIGLSLLLLLVLVTSSNAAQKLGDGAGANTHPHNLSNLNIGIGTTVKAGLFETDQICIFCHTPHNSSSDGPLWNRPRPAGPFPLYGRLGDIAIDDPESGSFYGDVYPNGASRLCLSCHDGVTAIGTVLNGGNIAPSLGSMTDESTLPGAVIDLSTAHPISFFYDEGVRIYIEANQTVAIPVDSYIVPGPLSGYLDGDSYMQCTTCHDPHLDTRTGTYDLPMWRDNLTADPDADYETTCKACHVLGSQSPGLDIKPAFGSGAGQGVHPIALP